MIAPRYPSTRFPQVSATDVLAEIEREAASRLRAYPALIDKLRLTAEAAALDQRLCEAWAADMRRWRDWSATVPLRAMPAQAHMLGFTWADRRAGIARELDRRARLYPKWISAAQLNVDEARRRTDRLSALADLYDEGWDWHDTFGQRPPFGRGMSREPSSPAEAECRQQWHAHVTHVLAARAGGHQQEQLAL